MNTDQADTFAALFAGRTDAYGTDNGRCARIAFNPSLLAQRHLDGTELVGIYPMVHQDNGWHVHWGCVDFDVRTKGKPSWDYEDEQAAHNAATDLQAVLASRGITSWVEQTRSHGRHVWVFATQWIPARIMRRALHVACTVAQVSSREVNPKQEDLPDAGSLGNYVRLPYAHGTERPMLDGDTPIPLNDFLSRALMNRVTFHHLNPIANLYVPPAPPPQTKPTFTPAGNAPRELNALGRALWQNGPFDGDRSRGMFALAGYARRSGLSPNEVYTVLKTCPWSKFQGRHDEDRRIQQIVERIWQ
jgi:hypothetical protein